MPTRWRTIRTRDDWDAAPETTGIDVLAELATGLGEAFDRARGRPTAAVRLRRARGDARPISAAAPDCAGAGCSRPDGSSSTPRSADRTASAWVGRADPGLHRRGHRRRCTPSPAPGSAGRRTQIELPPGRVRDPAAARGRGRPADLHLLDGQRPGRRGGPQRLRRSGDGTTRIGETLAPLPITLTSDPHYPGLETLPVRRFAVSAPTSTSWAFDVGHRSTATTWIDRGVLSELIRNRAQAAKHRAGRRPRRPTT